MPTSSLSSRNTSGQAIRLSRAIAGISIAAFALSATSSAAFAGETTVDLGTASSYSVLGASELPNTGEDEQTWLIWLGLALAVIIAGVVLEIRRPTLTKHLRKR